MHKEFTSHKLNEEGLCRANLIASVFDKALEDIEVAVGPDSDLRCLALTRTKLEEACFFAKKAMASNIKNQEKP